MLHLQLGLLAVTILILPLHPTNSLTKATFNETILQESGLLSCNQSVSPTIHQASASTRYHILIEQPHLEPSMANDTLGKRFHCKYEIRAPENYHAEVRVHKVITASSSFNYASKSGHKRKFRCGRKNYLRLWDGFRNHVWKPTELCGHYRGHSSPLVNRIMSGREAMIEFKVEAYTEQTAYEVRIIFVEDEVNHGMIGKHFGGYTDVDGRVQNTLCDWEVEINKCMGYCEITSPGYPGIYPPHLNCTYKLVNNEPDQRVELILQSGNQGKFDIKKTTQCAEDKMIIYDGDTKTAPIVGYFCGKNVPEIISRGNALLIEFVAYAGLPPWHYSGFDARVTNRMKAEPDSGMPIPNKPCSWEFDSKMANKKTFHTPDHRIEHETDLLCEYHFKGQPGEKVSVEISFTNLRKDKELIFFYDGTNLPEKIWNDGTVSRGRQRVDFKSDSSSPYIIYQLDGGQTSNYIPIYIYYEFIPAPTVQTENQSAQPTDTNGTESSPLGSWIIAFFAIVLRIMSLCT